jgi:transposase
MIEKFGTTRVYLACGYTDMRKSIDGLSALITYRFSLDPFSSSMFVFCNKHRNKLKILHWEHNGFWLYYKRLENGKFQWPEKGNTLCIDSRELQWLLSGLDLEQNKAHKKLSVNITI